MTSPVIEGWIWLDYPTVAAGATDVTTAGDFEIAVDAATRNVTSWISKTQQWFHFFVCALLTNDEIREFLFSVVN